MQDRISLSRTARDLNISITAYRALLILSLLLEKPLTRIEIEKFLKEDPITSKSYSLDTIRVTLNTLKSVGCIISRPTSKNNYKYILFSHPFGLELSQEQLKCLDTIRQNLVNLNDWQIVLNVNELYKKIFSVSKNIYGFDIINDTEPMSDINKELLKKIIKYAENKNKITIEYASPEQGIEKLDIIADKIIYEADKLYICCYSFKYNEYSYLRIDKIKSIKNLSSQSHIIQKNAYSALYMIKGDSVATYKLAEGEKILERTKDYIFVEAKVINEFKFVQRLFSFGSDFILKSPDELKVKLMAKLNLVRQGYSS